MKKHTKPATVSQLLRMLPDSLFDELAKETNVDFSVSKLHGRTLFCLLTQSLINHGKPSQRILENFYNSPSFEPFKPLGTKGGRTRHSSISDRLRDVNHIYYSRLMDEAFCIYSKLLRKEKYAGFTLDIFDSTMVSISSKLIEMGMRVGSKASKLYDHNNFIKFSFQLTNGLPKSFRIYTEQKYTSEEAALGNAVLEAVYTPGDIMLFDRGIQRRKTYGGLTAQGRWFVSRMVKNTSYRTVRANKQVKGQQSNTLILKEDLIIQLRDGDKKWLDETFRLITATSKETGEELLFITNIKEGITAKQVTEIYRQRWQIEIFFKFLKQELNICHLMGRSENAIRVVLHVTVIVAILIIAFKKLNKIDSYKIAKFRFMLELEHELVKEIVLICGGDISLLNSG